MKEKKQPCLDISERDFRKQVVELARMFRWEYYFTWNSIRSPRGFPDLVLARERVIFSELKTEKGKLTELQEHWQDVLRKAGAEVYIWKPSQFPEIVEILKG